MDYVYSVITILAGCGVFLLGFKLLSDNMEKLAGNGLKRLFNKTSDKKLVGVGLGAAATAVVQSSAITTVMVIGFVNTGIMSLKQAATIIMGANIGTTITAQIVALQAFNLNVFFMALAFIGMAMNMFSKKDKVRLAGIALAGLGIVFVGLDVMSGAMEGEMIHAALETVLSKATNPFFLLFIVDSVFKRGNNDYHRDGDARADCGRRRNRGTVRDSRQQYRQLRYGADFLDRNKRKRASRKYHSPAVQRHRHRYFHGSAADFPAVSGKDVRTLVLCPGNADRHVPHLLQRAVHVDVPAVYKRACETCHADRSRNENGRKSRGTGKRREVCIYG